MGMGSILDRKTSNFELRNCWSKMAKNAIFGHFQPKLEVFRSKIDPLQVFCAEKAFPHGFRTVRARLGSLLAIFIIFMFRSPKKWPSGAIQIKCQCSKMVRGKKFFWVLIL